MGFWATQYVRSLSEDVPSSGLKADSPLEKHNEEAVDSNEDVDTLASHIGSFESQDEEEPVSWIIERAVEWLMRQLSLVD